MAKVKAPSPSPVILVKYSNNGESHAPSETVINLSHNRDSKLIETLQTELDKLNYKYNAIFNSGNMVYAIVDKKLKFIDYSDGYEAFIGKLSQTPLKIGASLKDYFTGNMLDAIITKCNRVLKGETLMIERELRFEDGSSNWWLTEYAPIYNNQKITGIVVRARDITAQKIKSSN